MFVGHEFLAFAIAGWVALRFGGDDRAAIHAGLVAGVAALLPDLDIGYAVATYAVAVAGGTPLGWEPFWGVANATHRVVTHTLPTGGVATLVFGAAVAVVRRQGAAGARSRSRRGRVTTVTSAGLAVVGVATLLAGVRTAVSPAAAVVAAGFLACVAATGWALATRTELSTPAMTAAAGVGVVLHPFGDVFLAAPPPLFSPVGPPVWTGRVALSADPTLDLLGVLFVELATVWAGLVVFSRVASDRMDLGGRVRDAIDRRAVVGFAYAPTAVLLPRPTITDAHILGATIVPFAAIVGVWAWVASTRRDGGTEHADTGGVGVTSVYIGVVSATTALGLAAVAYAAVYTVV
jgi:hypothetical protein